MQLNFHLDSIEIYVFKGDEQFDLLHEYNLINTRVDRCNLELIWEKNDSNQILKFLFSNIKYLEIGAKNFENVYKKNQLFYRMLNIGFVSPEIKSEEVEYFEHSQNEENSLHLIMFFGDDEFIRIYAEKGDIEIIE